MNFFCRKVLLIFCTSAFVAGILWFFIINQAIVDTLTPVALPEISSDISISKMVLHIDDAVIHADQILGDRASKNVQLIGNAKLYWKEFEFIGTNFQYFKNEHRINTLDKITIIMPNIITTADSMSINTQEQLIQLSGTVCTVFHKK